MRYISFVSLLILSVVCNAQVLKKQSGDAVIKEDATNKVYYRTFVLSGLSAAQTVSVAITCTDIEATLGKDYNFTSPTALNTKTLSLTDTVITVGVIVNTDNNDEKDERFILSLVYLNATVPTVLYDTIMIRDKDFKTKGEPDTSKWQVRIVTGSNFDFFDAPTFKNYAGDLNIFLPDLFGNGFGLNAGVFNYRYYDADSSGNDIVTENYLLDATTRTLVPGTTKYVQDLYYLDSKTSYNNIGVYLNPMYKIEGIKSKWCDVYLDLHAEVIWRTQIMTHSQKPIRKDTMTITQADTERSRVFQNYKSISSLYNKTSYFDSYFGLGLPFKANIKKAFELFVTPTLGVCVFKATAIDVYDDKNIRSRVITEKQFTEPFFLTKFQLTTTVSPIDITLGGELRSVFNKSTFFGMYLGAAVSLDKLKR